ncbi:Zinc finger CHC2-type domain-containing protein [Methylorubrum populi]
MSRSAAYDDWVAEARAVPMEAVVAQLGTRLKRRGAESVGPCPVCGGRDRFGVNHRKQLFHCRGSGEGGDVIALTRYLQGCSFPVACEILTGRPPPGRVEGETAEQRAEREAALAKRAAARAKLTAEKEEEEARFRERERKRCWEIWEAAAELPGTPAEAYLRLRGLEAPPGAPLRCALDHPLYADGGRDAAIVHRGPALVAKVRGPNGRFAGLHATWIDVSAPKGKVLVPDADGEWVPAKKVRGSARGGHIPLVLCQDPAVLVLGEGIETVLSVWRALVATGWPDLGRTAFWAAYSLGNMAGPATETVRHPTLKCFDKLGRARAAKVPGPFPDLTRPGIVLPPSVTRLHLLGDGDSDRFTTETAMKRAGRRYRAARPDLDVLLSWAPEGGDFNDILMGAAA